MTTLINLTIFPKKESDLLARALIGIKIEHSDSEQEEIVHLFIQSLLLKLSKKKSLTTEASLELF